MKPGENEAATAEKEYHHYCFGLIRLFLELVLVGASSMGSASASLKLMRMFLPGVMSAPTAECGQLWLLRIGLYEVIRPKEKTEDRIWIIDHTVQIGDMKCLLILGCRSSWWQENRGPLNHRDVEVLALEPVVKSDGEIVRTQLEDTAVKTGTPRAIVSDHGSDIKRGIEAFQEDHPQTVDLYDIAHKIAILLKRELEADTNWAAYVKHLGQAKQCLQQTALAFLTPPSFRNKARYMNLEKLVSWGMNALAYLDDPHSVSGEPVDEEVLRAKLGWLVEYGKPLVGWNAMMRVIATTLEYIREDGYHRGAVRKLRRQLRPIAMDPQSRRLAEKILDFVKEQSTHAGAGEHLTGTSECIESLIGKGKRLAGQQSKGGFTRIILGMAAAVVNPTKDYITKAFANVRTRDVTQWCRDKLGVSVQSQRQRALGCSACGTKMG